MVKTTEFIENLRKTDEKLGKIKLVGITVSKEKMTAVFDFINNVAIDGETQAVIERAVNKNCPDDIFDISVNVRKVVADEELIKKATLECLNAEFAHISYSFSSDKTDVKKTDDGFEVSVFSGDDEYGYLEKGGAVQKIADKLDRLFCETVKIVLINNGKSDEPNEIQAEDENASDYETLKIRTFKVSDAVKLFGEDTGDTAMYIADADLVSGGVVFAGRVYEKTEKIAKSGKPFYIFGIDDTTGKISGMIFHTKEKEKKLGKIEEGSEIVIGGEMETYNGRRSLKINDVSFCVFPKNFVPEEREGKRAPDKYSLVFPREIEEVKQSNIFDVKKEVVECLKGRKFVVVDIETTGTSYVGGDRITEIGAVRIEDGEIVNCFQTLINPKIGISKEITELTGIDDEMVKDSPEFDEVLPDFYKYCEDCVIVAHNIDFDYNFIKHMSKKSGYVFKNKGIDTLALSKEILPRLRNHKLNTVCKYFNIEFLHHRALSDAHATAKLFIELINIKKSLPN